MKPSELVAEKKADIIKIANTYGASNLRLFGSIAHNEDTEKSDIDLLLEMSKPHSLLKRGGLKCELEELLGVRVDVVYSSNPNIDQSIIKESIAL